MIKRMLLTAGMAASLACTAHAAIDSTTMGASYRNQVWYKFGQGVVDTSLQTSWHLAFETGGMAGGILVNDGQGISVYQVPDKTPEDWATIDTTGIKTWPVLVNDASNWSIGAFNRTADPNDQFDFGWGAYSMVSHTIAGNKVFVIALPAATPGGQKTYWKMRVDGLASSTYTFTYSRLDGSEEHTGSVVKTEFAGKHFGYWSLATHSTLDREPLSADWDITWVKYMQVVPAGIDTLTGEMQYAPYPVTGILTNAGVETAKVITHTPTSEPVPADDAFSTANNLIKHDWKTVDMNTGVWAISDTTAFFVKQASGAIYRVVFQSFSGSSSGVTVFQADALATSVDDAATAGARVAVYPNVIEQGGHASIVLDGQAQSLRVYSSTGTLVRDMNAASFGNFAEVQLSGLASGMYHVVLVSGTNTATAQFVIR